jgi:hypothetical protein
LIGNLQKTSPLPVDVRRKVDIHLVTDKKVPTRPSDRGGFFIGGRAMTVLQIRWQDVDGLRRFDNGIKALGEDGRKVMQRALARSGDMARTQVYRALTKQTGLKRKVIVRALKIKRPSYTDLTYEMRARGGEIALKYFDPRETRAGVSAAPFGKRRVFPSTFMKGGRFPNRSGMVFQGHVLKREGADRFPIKVQKSEVVIPNEMITGATADAFLNTVRARLPQRVEHELARLLP